MEHAAVRPPTPAGRLRASARARADATALVWQDQRISYAELDARVDAGVGALRALGVGPGQRVALVLPNTPAFVESWYAVLRLGAVAVPAAPALAPDELRHVLADSGACVAVVAADRAADVSSLRPRLPQLHGVVAASGTPAAGDDADHVWSALVDWHLDDEPAGATGLPTSDAAGLDAPDGHDDPRGPDDSEGRDTPEGCDPAGPVDHGDRDEPDRLAALVYTSGTTGRPRGAMLTTRNLVANQDQSLAGRLRLEPDDVVLAVLPLFHIYGLNVVLGPALTAGCAVVLQERFDVVLTAELVADRGVTVVPGAPAMYVAWAQHPPTADFGAVRLCASGAAPLPRAAAARFTDATGVPVHNGYGLTEAGPAVCSSAQDDQVRPGSVGRPLPGVELRLVVDGRDVEPGDPGEVWVRGDNVFAGYWKDEAATAAALTEDGWLRTGDVGALDEDGWLHLLDRRTDLILVSGFNVYPREVERVLRTHPAVADVAVVGRPDPTTGETPVAHVVPADGATVVTEDLAAHCRTQLAAYKCPTSYVVADALPTTVTGKVRRTDLRGL